MDLVLTIDLEIKSGIQINAPVDNADHVLLWTIECRPKSVNSNIKYLFYNQADY